MSLPYVINYTDPLAQSFSIPVSGFNGPGGTQANTTLRLYGRGALDWGEATDENLVRLAENFSGATAPLYPIDGQVWREVLLYWHDTTAGNYAGWHVFNTATNTWGLLNGTGVVASGPTTPSIGFHYYDNAANLLYLYDSRYKQQAAGFFTRSFTSSTTSPGTTPPETFWQVYSEGAGAWLYNKPTIVKSSAPPDAKLEPGNFWLNTTTGSLSVRVGTTWVAVATGGSIYNAGGGAITNLPNQTYPLPNSNDAATISYVNSGISSALSGSSAGAISALGTGIVVKTGTTSFAARSIVPGTGILILNGDGVAGNTSVAVDTSVIATQAYVNAQVAASTGGVITVEPVSAGVPSNAVGNNGDIRYQY